MSGEEFENAKSLLDDALRSALKSFADWTAEQWLMEEGKDKWPHAEEYPGDEYLKAFNDGLRTVPDALTCFLDEMGYS
jgi:hypothetical protein